MIRLADVAVAEFGRFDTWVSATLFIKGQVKLAVTIAALVQAAFPAGSRLFDLGECSGQLVTNGWPVLVLWLRGSRS